MQAILSASAVLDKSKDTVRANLWIRDENGVDIINQVKFGYAQIVFPDLDPQYGWGDGDWGDGTYTDDNEFSRTYFDKSYADNEGKMEVTFNHPFSITDLQLHVSLELDNTLTFDGTFPVIVESGRTLENLPIIEQPFQPNKHTDRKRPLPEHASSSLPEPSMPQLIEQAKEEIVSVPDITLRGLALNFGLQSPNVKGDCDLGYAGGGSRLLEFKTVNLSEGENTSLDDLTNEQRVELVSNFDQSVIGDSVPTDIFLSHVRDDIPWLRNAKVYAESNATNLLTNQRFFDGNKVPTGYAFVSANSVVSSSLVTFISPKASVWEINVADARAGGEEVFFQADNSSIIDSGRPLTLSAYINILARTPDSDLDKLRIIFYFRDSSDVLLDTKIKEIDPRPLITFTKSSLPEKRFSEFTQVYSSIHPSEYPLNTEKVFWQISVSEVNIGDSFLLSLMLPQLEQTKSPTTFVVEDTRAADTITIKQENCLQLGSGEIGLSFIANHEQPLYDTYFFDTRHPVTLLNGFAAWHEAGTNLIKFSVADLVTNQVTVSDGPVTFVQGSRIDFKVKWIESVREIWLGDGDNDQIVMDLTPYSVPTDNNVDIFLGSDAKATPQSFLNSELKEFKINKFLLSQFIPIP